MAGLSYLDTGKKVYGTLKKGYYGLQSILLTLAFMALLRMKNPEQLKNANPGDFGIMLGLDRCPEVRTLRRKLNELGLHNQSGKFMETLSRAWVEQDKDILGFLYIDGHVRPYHGRKHTLPKTHVARRRLCMPATTDFWVNGTRCEPLFFVTTEAKRNHCFARTIDEGRAFIKNVFQQPADMNPNYNEGRLEIRFHTISTRRENESLAELCNQQ